MAARKRVPCITTLTLIFPSLINKTQTTTMVVLHEEEEGRLSDQGTGIAGERDARSGDMVQENMAEENMAREEESSRADNDEMHSHDMDPHHPQPANEQLQQYLEVQHQQDHIEQAQPRRRNEDDREDPFVIDLQNDRADLLVQAQERHRNEPFLSAPNSLYAMLHRAEVHGTATPPPPPQPRERENLPRPTIQNILGQAMEILRDYETP